METRRAQTRKALENEKNQEKEKESKKRKSTRIANAVEIQNRKRFCTPEVQKQCRAFAKRIRAKQRVLFEEIQNSLPNPKALFSVDSFESNLLKDEVPLLHLNGVRLPNMHKNIPREYHGGTRCIADWLARLSQNKHLQPHLGNQFIAMCTLKIKLIVKVADTQDPKLKWVKRVRKLKRCPRWQVQEIVNGSSCIDVAIHGIHKAKRFFHSNMIWIDHKNKQFELFEPHGHNAIFSPTTTTVAHELSQLLPGYTHQAILFPRYGEQRDGPQTLTHDRNCGFWSLLYVQLKCLNPQLSTLDVFQNWWQALIEMYGIKWKTQLRQYMQRFRVWSRYNLILH